MLEQSQVIAKNHASDDKFNSDVSSVGSISSADPQDIEFIFGGNYNNKFSAINSFRQIVKQNSNQKQDLERYLLNKKSKLKILKRYLCFWRKKKKKSKIVQEFERGQSGLDNQRTDSFGAVS